MKSHLKAVTAAALAIVGWAVASPASAALYTFNTCWSSCDNVDPGNLNTTVATLELTQDGFDVDFTFTNTVGNLGADAGTNTFISQLLFSYDGDNALDASDIGNYGGTTDGGPVLTDANFSFGSFNNATLDFQIEGDLPTSNSGGGVNRFKNGEILTWTISNVEVAEFFISANSGGQLGLVHIQSLGGCDPNNPNADCGSVKYVDGNGGGGEQVPEPGSLALLGLGLAGLALARRRRV